MKYTYERNYCDCHPETCGCNGWVVKQGDIKITSAYSEDEAKDLCKRLNKGEQSE